MSAIWDPFSLVVISIAGWMNQRQQHVIEYPIEENRRVDRFRPFAFLVQLCAGACASSVSNSHLNLFILPDSRPNRQSGCTRVVVETPSTP